MSVAQTGGDWDKADKPVYFLAGNTSRLDDLPGMAPFMLIAVNELQGENALAILDRWLTAGVKVFLDSGVFELSTSHAKKHGLSMDDALRFAPEKVDGFDKLFARYCEIVERFGSRLWGYIEIDQGGRENKIRTRARLEEKGFAPIPVYHPLVDGPEYFDYLASRYDRICFGNVVQANQETRKRLIASMWERRRAYPDLWIHILGYTPDERLFAFPADSADSSTWLSPMRWPDAGAVRTSGRTLGEMRQGFQYRLGAGKYDEDGPARCTRLQAREALSEMRCWRRAIADQAEILGVDAFGRDGSCPAMGKPE
jgi:hypothetical protein